MKKFFGLLIFILGFGLFASTFACECFGDPLSEVDMAGVAKQGVNIRNLPCMHASQVVKVARAGEKMRILTKDPGWRYKVAVYDANGNVVEGRVAQSFVNITNDRTGVPPKPSSHIPKSYCDTLDQNRCPVKPACSKDIQPEFYYKTQTTQTQENTQTTQVQETTTTQQNNSNVYGYIDNLVNKFDSKLNAKYPSNFQKQIEVLDLLISRIDELKSKVKSDFVEMFDYLEKKLEEIKIQKQNLLEINNILQLD